MSNEQQIQQQADQLKISEERYRMLFEGANDAILIINGDKFIDCNSKTLALFGCSDKTEIIGAQFWQFSPLLQPDGTDSRKKGDEIKSAALNGSPQHFHWKYVKKDGTLFDAEVSLNCTNIGSEIFMQAVIRDITDHLISKDALQESEEVYRKLVMTVPEMIVRTDLDGNIKFLNETAFPTMKLWTKDRLMGKNLFSFIDSKDKQRAYENFKSRFTQQIGLHEYKLHFDDGISLDCEVNGNVLFDKENTPYEMVFVIRDISERKKIDLQLLESEERFRVIFANAAIGVALVDTNGYPVKSNNALLTMLGYTEKELSEMTFAQFTHPEDIDDDLILYDELFKGKRNNYQIEKRYYTKDGSILWCRLHVSLVRLENGNPQFAIGIVEDITKHKFAEQALQESEKRYRDLVETMPDGVYRSTHAGKFLDINQSMVKILGYSSKEELKNIDIKSELYFHKGDRESAALDEQYAEMATFRLKKKDGSEVWVEDHGRHVVDENGNILFHEGIIRDITARKLAETERKNLETQLFQVQKLESIGTLAAGIAHDFNNILNIIMGNVNMINRKSVNEDKLMRRVEIILNAADRGTQLVKQLLAYARKTDIEQQTVFMNDLIAETVQLLEETFPKTIEMSLLLKHDLPNIQGDLNQLHQILVNLCVNARDAMPNGGALKIQTESVPLNEIRKKFSNAAALNYVLVTVKDSGMGMDEHVRKNIFDPFFTTKEKGKGTGLGLAVVFGIVDNHNGFVEVMSRPGEGSEFHIYLPAGGVQTVLTKKEVTPFMVSQGYGETILVAEDDQFGRDLIKEIFEESGYNVIITENGDDAIDEFEKNSASISLVLTDLDLPKSDGEKVCRRIKQLRSDIPLVVMSGFVGAERAESLHKIGIEDIVLKPYSFDDLLMRIRKILDSNLIEN